MSLRMPAQKEESIVLMDLFDDEGRRTIQNAVFSRIVTMNFIGVGGLPLVSQNRFNKIESLEFGELYIGIFEGILQLMLIRPAVIPVHANYSIQIKEDGDTLIPFKKFHAKVNDSTVDDVCWLTVEDADLVTIFEYKKRINSSNSATYNFLKKKGTFRIAKVPLPNHYVDGKICIGSDGVTCRDLPAPSTLASKMHECINNDKYNSDLAEENDISHLFGYNPNTNKWEKVMNFEDCNTIMNENVIGILPTDLLS